MTKHIIQQSEQSNDGRCTAAAALRNTGPICDVLAKHLPKQGRVLEVASGTGQHVAAFAATFPALVWQPSDVDAGQRDSIAAWMRQSGLKNVSEPLDIDVSLPWPVDNRSVQVVLTINLFHLIPASLVSRFFEQARLALQEGGRVMIYGPFKRGADFASEGDRDFDASLRARDPLIGYKSVGAVTDVAAECGFMLIANEGMPANNLMLVFEV